MVVVGVQATVRLLRVEVHMDQVEVVKVHIHLHPCLPLVLEEVILDQLNKVILVERDLQMVDHILVPLVEQVEEVVVLEAQELPVQHLNQMKVVVELDFKF
tara:strand:- start:648 stop:950 length:303 start_codon:yes stop_codon:yes gene_type:complete